jgi:hypothetical protein
LRVPQGLAWERIEEDESDPIKEYWLRPVSTKVLRSGDSLSFSNFQVNIERKKGFAFSIEGYIYWEENQDGISALNSISINY